MLRFDLKALQIRLGKLQPTAQLCFAVSCSERLFSLYALYSDKTGRGSPDYLRGVLDNLIAAVIADEYGAIDNLFGDYVHFIPGEDTQWSPLNPVAENAVSALAYACGCGRGEGPEAASWAGLQAYEAADYIAHTLGEIDFGGSETEAVIRSTACVQDELRRQAHDIDEIEHIATQFPRGSAAYKGILTRAHLDGSTLVPIASGLLVA